MRRWRRSRRSAAWATSLGYRPNATSPACPSAAPGRAWLPTNPILPAWLSASAAPRAPSSCPDRSPDRSHAPGSCAVRARAARRRGACARPRNRDRSWDPTPWLSALLAVGDVDAEPRAAGSRLHQDDVAAMRPRQIARDGQPQARAAAARRAREGLEELGQHRLRDAGPIVRDGEAHHASMALGHDLDARAVALAERFDGIAQQIEHDAIELLGIGVDDEGLIDRVGESDRAGRGLERGLAGLVDERLEQGTLARGRALVCTAVTQGLRRQRHR